MSGRYRLRPDQWGIHGWRYMDAYARAFPESPTPEQQEDAQKLYLTILQTLPCASCQEHSLEILKRGEVTLDAETLSSGRALRDFVYQLRQAVHREAHLPQESRETYHQIMNPEHEDSSPAPAQPHGGCSSCYGGSGDAKTGQGKWLGLPKWTWVVIVSAGAAMGLWLLWRVYHKRKNALPPTATRPPPSVVEAPRRPPPPE